MANAATVNLVEQNNGELFHAIWKLTRTMLAAGWQYKASSLALTNTTWWYNYYETSYYSQNVYGGSISSTVNAAQQYTGASVTAYSSSLMTLTIPAIPFCGVPQPNTCTCTNGSPNVTGIPTNTACSAGDIFTFVPSTSTRNPGSTTFYVCSTNENGTTTIPLTTNFGGTTGTYIFSRLSCIGGPNSGGPCTFTLAASSSVTTSVNTIGWINVGDQIMFSSQLNTYYTVTAVTSSSITLNTSYTGTTGSGKYGYLVSNGFNASCVGQNVTISGAANSSGTINGTYLIIAQPTFNTIQVYNPSGASTDSNNGSIALTLVKDAALDLWGVGGAVNIQNVSGTHGSGSGTGVTIVPGGPYNGTYGYVQNSGIMGYVTITGVTGFSQTASPGRYVTITGSTQLYSGGATLFSNNGSYRIVSANSAGTSVVIYAPQLIPETGNSSLTVVEQYGGADGTLGAFSTLSPSGTGQSTLINFTTSTFTGFTASDVGKRITILNATNTLTNSNTFTIAQYVSSNNVLLYGPGCTASDSNTSLQWVETDPLQQTYSSNWWGNGCSGSWIILQGPSTIKVPIGNNTSTGVLIRGENVVQSSTGAQGELLGYNYDPTGGGQGYLVIAPRVVGTGSSGWSGCLYGWNNSGTDTVTGGISGATVTTTAGPPVVYVREMMIQKFSSSTGNVYYQCIDQNPLTESATTPVTGRFSTMANTLTQSWGCISHIVAPGGSFYQNAGSLLNALPRYGTMVMIGWTGTGVPTYYAATTYGTSTYGYWTGCSNVGSEWGARAHTLVANNIEQQGISQDGSWIYLQSAYYSGNPSAYLGMACQRLDNQEDGDVDPYACQVMSSYTPATAVATACGTTNINNADNYSLPNVIWSSYSQWRGFRRRGMGQGDNFYGLQMAYLYDPYQGTYIMGTSNGGIPDQVATAFTPTNVREPIWLYIGGTAGYPRMRKGTPRWMMLSQGTFSNQTFDSMKWISLSNSGNAQFVVGPWDGATVPTF